MPRRSAAESMRIYQEQFRSVDVRCFWTDCMKENIGGSNTFTERERTDVENLAYVFYRPNDVFWWRDRDDWYREQRASQGLKVPWGATTNEELHPATVDALNSIRLLDLRSTYHPERFTARCKDHLTSIESVCVAGTIPEVLAHVPHVPHVEASIQLAIDLEDAINAVDCKSLALRDGVVSLAVQTTVYESRRWGEPAALHALPPAQHPASLRKVVVVVPATFATWDMGALQGLMRAVFDPTHLVQHRQDQDPVRYTFLIPAEDIQLAEDKLLAALRDLVADASEAQLSADATASLVADSVRIVGKGSPEYASVLKGEFQFPAVPEDGEPWFYRAYKDKVKAIPPQPSNGYALLKSLERSLLACPEPFTCGDSLQVSDLQALYARNVKGDGLAFFSDTDADALYALGVPAPFGRGSETVLDVTYRTAHEIKPPHFAIASDPLSSILHEISGVMDSGPLTATIAKLNIYAKGGFFKPHRDTPRGENHVGTITLGLPSTYTGGELAVRHNGEQVTYDWSCRATLEWAFLYSNCEHEVLPVTSDTRVTVAYDVFSAARKKPVKDEMVFNSAVATLQRVLSHPTYFPKGACWLSGPQHLSQRVAIEELVAVYGEAASRLPTGENELKMTRIHRFASVGYKERELFALPDFHTFQDKHFGEYSDKLPRVLGDGQIVHWVTPASGRANGNMYTTFGNEAQASIIYAAVGLFLWVGPPQDRGSPNLDGRKKSMGFGGKRGEEDEEDEEDEKDDEDEDEWSDE